MQLTFVSKNFEALFADSSNYNVDRKLYGKNKTYDLIAHNNSKNFLSNYSQRFRPT